MTIGNRIRKRRKEMNLSVEELARLLGKNRATVYRYENGDIENLPTTILEPIAKALNTTPTYLMGWETALESNADFIHELFRDTDAIIHIKKLSVLNLQSRHSVYDMIDFLIQRDKGL